MPQEGKLFVFDRMWQLTAWTPELLCGKSANSGSHSFTPTREGGGAPAADAGLCLFQDEKKNKDYASE